MHSTLHGSVRPSAPRSGTESSTAPNPGYGRARLWLGISAVGAMVTLAAAALLLDLPAPLPADTTIGGHLLAIGAFVGVYALLHLPLDLFGGYLLPRWFGRAHPSPARFALSLVRGVGVHGAMLWAAGAALLLGGAFGGAAGAVGAGVVVSVVLLALQTPLARAASRLTDAPEPAQLDDAPPIRCLTSDDEGFTGGVTGVIGARRIVLPDRWRHTLAADGFRLAARRRALAISTGSWLRGRIVALAFVWIGLGVSASIAGAEDAGTASGVVRMSLLFTLWSFLGLLILPTISRRGVAEVDAHLRADAPDRAAVDDLVRRLDRLQDDEPERPGLVETIFHPVPSVRNRTDNAADTGPRGAWNAARTSVFIGAAGLSLLGRAVHCNCGRPALWVFLPTD